MNCIVLMGFLPWEIRVAFPGESKLRESRATQPTVYAGCFRISIIHRTLHDVDYRIFNVRTDVNTCDCIREWTDTVRSLHWKLTLGEKPLPKRGIEYASVACRPDALPTELYPPPPPSPYLTVEWVCIILLSSLICGNLCFTKELK